MTYEKDFNDTWVCLQTMSSLWKKSSDIQQCVTLQRGLDKVEKIVSWIASDVHPQQMERHRWERLTTNRTSNIIWKETKLQGSTCKRDPGNDKMPDLSSQIPLEVVGGKQTISWLASKLSSRTWTRKSSREYIQRTVPSTRGRVCMARLVASVDETCKRKSNDVSQEWCWN